MLASDLAALYGVETKVLVQAVKRNSERFPADFMFQLNNHEVTICDFKYYKFNYLRCSRLSSIAWATDRNTSKY